MCTFVGSNIIENTKSKIFDSYFIEKYDSGIYMVMFNTFERGIKYHLVDDSVYMFSNGFENDNYEIVYVEEFLPTDTSFVRSHSQCKDQIYFYFIPFDLILDKDEK